MLLEKVIDRIFKRRLGAIDSSTPVVAGSTLAVTGATTLTGAATLTGGIVATPPLKIWNHVPTGALATRGTDGARTAGTTYYAEVWLPANKTITGVGVLLGTTAGTDKIAVCLYDSVGALVANSAAAGVITATGDVYQQVALTATYAAKGPARFFIGVQINGTTDGLQFNTTLGPLMVTGSFAGTFGTFVDPIASVATTHTDNLGPMAYLY